MSLKAVNAVSIILAVCVVLVFRLALPWYGEYASRVLLDYIRVVFSWPVAILVLGLILFTRFHGAVDYFIRNLKSMKFPGGAEIQTQDGPAIPEAATDDSTGPGIVEGSATATARGTASARAEVVKSGGRSGTEGLTEEQRWKFSYLALFFVPNTKRVLQWFHEKGDVDRADYHAFWSSLIPGVDQSAVILGVLMQYGMLEDSAGRLRITAEGSKFLHFTGFWPY